MGLFSLRRGTIHCEDSSWDTQILGQQNREPRVREHTKVLVHIALRNLRSYCTCAMRRHLSRLPEDTDEEALFEAINSIRINKTKFTAMVNEVRCTLTTCGAPHDTCTHSRGGSSRPGSVSSVLSRLPLHFPLASLTPAALVSSSADAACTMS
jgi:hypothetical protein